MPEAGKKPPGLILKGEEWWRDHYLWLESCGYRLRSRYAPGWTPSWEGTKKGFDECEDGQRIYYNHLADAARISDGAFVSLKLIRKSYHPYEIGIGNYFSSEPQASDPANHCVPFLEVLQPPKVENEAIIVMPFLRKYGDPRFDTFGEAVEYFRQIFEGLQFMHHHHVAHRDCSGNNIMMDATLLYPRPYHPRAVDMRRDWKGRARALTRTQKRIRYYLIDFGISRQYNPEDGPPLEDPIWGGDKTVPEFQISDDACDPFPTDIYYLGNMIHEDFLMEKLGFEFMRPLVDDMRQTNPKDRPSMDEVVARFETIRASLSSWKLRSRVIKRDDLSIFGFFRAIAHWTRRIGFIVRRVPTVPVLDAPTPYVHKSTP